MNANPNLGRRQFLQAGTAAGAVLALGFDSLGNIVKAAEGAAAPAASPFGPTLFDTWLRFNPDNTITVVSGEVEFGQGVNTGVATLAAEELDADMSQMRVAQSSGAFVYANPGTHSISTNSSASMRNRFDQIRKIGATGRMMLLQAASDQWKVPVGELTTASGSVKHASSNRTATYGSLAAAAAKLPIPASADVPLKAPEQWKLIGAKDIKRIDIVEKCTGKANYGADVRVPNMLHAAIQHSPVLGGKVVSFDATATKAKPGVKDVLDLGWGVAVIADNEWTARTLARDLKVTWDGGTSAGISSATIAKDYSDALANTTGAIAKKTGDVDAAAKAPGVKVVEAEYVLPYLYHATMEPHNTCVWAHDGIVEIWTPTAHTSNVIRAAQYVLGLTPDKVKIYRTPYSGGSFGGRGRADVEVQAMVISQKMNAPIHVLRSREEDVQHENARPYERTKIKAVVDGSGNLTSWHQKIACQSINATFLKEVSTYAGVDYAKVREDNIKLMGAFMSSPYDFFAANATPAVPPYNNIPNIHVETVTMDGTMGVSHWRSVGKSGGIWIEEAFVDELAEAAKMDPIAFRKKAFANNARAQAVLDRIAKEVKWQPVKWGAKPTGTAWGMAYTDMGYGAMGAIACQVKVTGKKFQILRLVSVIDQGVTINPDLSEAQVQGGIVDGISTMLYGELTLKDGKIQQSNFGDYRLLTLRETPAIESITIESKERPGSISEMCTPLVIPAITNALYAATGTRIRELPLSKAGLSI